MINLNRPRLSLRRAPLWLFAGLLAAFSLALAAGSPAGAAGGKVGTLSELEIAPAPAERPLAIENGQADARTGAPVALWRVNYPARGETAEAQARDYLSANAEFLGLKSADLADLSLAGQRQGPAGATVRFDQTANGLPVYAAEIAVHISPAGLVTYVSSSYRPDVSLAPAKPALSAEQARQALLDHLGAAGPFRYDQTSLAVQPTEAGGRLIYLVRVVADQPAGDWEALVDAASGDLLQVLDKYHYQEGVDGSGNVFDPDPLSSAGAEYGDPGYTDNSDATSPQLDAELVNMTLPDVTFTGAEYQLVGPYAEIRDSEMPFNGLFPEADGDWDYNRFDDNFEAAHTYFHIDQSMRYINVTLGIPLAPIQYVGGARYDPHGLNGADNSHYSSVTGEVAFGEGGVDDAEDADVVLHELGHAIHDWITGGSLSQVEGLSEGTGDYWAASYSRSLGQWTPADPQYYWVFDWDGHNPFWPGRITNYTGHYPEDLTGQIHTDGQIWSTSLMRIFDDIGQERIDAAVLEGLAMTGGSTNQDQAANAVMQAAIDMGYTSTELIAIHASFTLTGYTVPLPVEDFTLSADPASQAICAGDNANYTIDVGSLAGFNDPVTLAASGNPAPSAVSFTPNPVTPPGSSDMEVSNTGGVADGDYTITVSGTALAITHEIDVGLSVYSDPAGTVNLLSPPDGATGVSVTPTFSWSAAVGAAAYELEVATDAGFTNIVYAATVAGTSHTAESPLASDTTHYWRVRASNPCGDGPNSAVFDFTTGGVSEYCFTPNLAIPDADPAGVSDTQTVGDSGTLTDLNVSLDVPHTWVGDLEFWLEHDGTVVTLMDRPGVPATTFGCGVDDVLAEFDDEGADGPVEAMCNPTPPAIFGTPVPQEALSAFDGAELNGDWSLHAADHAGGDEGALVEWCLLPATEPTAAPEIDVSPTSLASSQPADTQVEQTLTIANTGDAPLTWAITEAPADCATPGDIPWVSVDPTAGTTAAGGASAVAVTFDSAGLALGVYTGTLCVASNDADEALIEVP
ncbi:MAG: BACON domain-containing protein, partial [Candidatus Promineifilaceae bacterium]